MSSLRNVAFVRGFVLPRERYFVGWAQKDDPDWDDGCWFERSGLSSIESARRHADRCAALNQEYVFFVFDDDDGHDPLKYRSDAAP